MEKKFLFNCLIFKKNGLFTSLKNQMWSNFVILGALLLLSAACNNANNDSGVVINEIMASNHSSIMAQDGELYDWIELKNISNKPESLDKFTLVVEKIDNYSNDNQDNATQKSWQLPAVEIKPGECILIFASKKDNSDSNGELHADFKLPSKGGKLMLKQGENVVSEVPFVMSRAYAFNTYSSFVSVNGFFSTGLAASPANASYSLTATVATMRAKGV